MNISRRDLGLLLPIALPALAPLADAQQPPAGAAPTPRTVLPSKLYHSDRIPYKGDDKKKGREFFHGTTHAGYMLEMHETILGPGEISHPPHRHVHEEIILIMGGTIEASVEGRKDTAGAGSVSYFASNEMHNFRNVGSGPCRYYVLELRADAA